MSLILFGSKERYDSEFRVAATSVKHRTAIDEHRNAECSNHLESAFGEVRTHVLRSPCWIGLEACPP
jgi:hypothetical protein